MTKNHPITPPLELVREWLCSEDYLSDASTFSSMTITSSRLQNVATQAARWGADQELQACCEWLVVAGWFLNYEHAGLCQLRAARRPKPPSLAEQALLAHRRIWNEGINHTDCGLILRALERLQELEGIND